MTVFFLRLSRFNGISWDLVFVQFAFLTTHLITEPSKKRRLQRFALVLVILIQRTRTHVSGLAFKNNDALSLHLFALYNTYIFICISKVRLAHRSRITIEIFNVLNQVIFDLLGEPSRPVELSQELTNYLL